MIYVDDLVDYDEKGLWCHMISDASLDELHAFARRIGLKRAWFQPRSLPHYDLRHSKRGQAIAAGATAVGRHEYLAAVKRFRAAPAEETEVSHDA